MRELRSATELQGSQNLLGKTANTDQQFEAEHNSSAFKRWEHEWDYLMTVEGRCEHNLFRISGSLGQEVLEGSPQLAQLPEGRRLSISFCKANRNVLPPP